MRNRIGRGLSLEIRRLQAEAAEYHKETERIQKEAAEQHKKSKQELEELDRRTKRAKEEADEQRKRTDRVLEDLGKQMGGLHRSFGEMAEHLVAPGIVDRFNEMGFHIEQAATHGMRIFDEKREVKAEIDLFMGNGDYIIAVEVKAQLGEKDIEKHQRRLEILREHANKTGDRRKILGGIAVAILGETDKKKILDAGFYVIVQSGDTMKLDLPEGFVPREW
jgi:hypothetical protein